MRSWRKNASAERLVVGVRRHLRVVWAAAFLQWVAPAVFAAVFGIAVLGFFGPWSLNGTAILVALGALLVGVIGAAVGRRIGLDVAARAADRGLRSGDALMTSRELRQRGDDGPFAERVHVRADRLASGHRPTQVVPVRAEQRRLAVGGLLGAASLALIALPSPQDAPRARRAQQRELVRAEASRIRKAAADVRRLATPQKAASSGVAERLDRLARELQNKSTLADAQKALEGGIGDLSRQTEANSLATKTAAKGLERSLAGRPLTTTTSGRASEQLRRAAQELSKLNATQRKDLADRLAGLARAQRSANPELADALQRAANALRKGELAAAKKAMEDAARLQQQALDRAAAEEQAQKALDQLQSAQDRISEASRPQGSPQSQDATPSDQAAAREAQQTAAEQTAEQQSTQQAGEGGVAAEGPRPGERPGPGGQLSNANGGRQVREIAPGQGSGESQSPGQGQTPGQRLPSPGQGQTPGQGQGQTPGQGQGQSPGQGQGQTPGQGQGQSPGQGQGQGPGQGQGRGPGQGQGPGGQGLGQGPVKGIGPSGRVRGRLDDGTGNNVGVGGKATVDGSGQQPVDAGVSTGPPKLFDPNVGDTARLRAQAATNEGPSKVVGKADGQTKTGQLRTPLSAALPRYSRRAAAASHSPSLTPSERSLVKSYFEQLQQAANPQPAVNSKPAAPSNPATAPSVLAKKGTGS